MNFFATKLISAQDTVFYEFRKLSEKQIDKMTAGSCSRLWKELRTPLLSTEMGLTSSHSAGVSGGLSESALRLSARELRALAIWKVSIMSA